MASMVSVVLTEDPEDLRKKRKEQWWGAYNDTEWYVIEPMAFWKAAFDGCTALLLLVLAFYIPFSIAFLDVGDFIWFDWYQLVWFSVDIILSFCSPYENEEGWVTNPKWIAAEYFQCFFWVDTISTFPFVLVLGASSGASPLTKLLKMPRLIKALRVLKMTKLTRAYKLDEVISQLATHLHVPPNAATLVILGMLGLVVNHVFACIWYYLGADDFSEECSTATVPARACTWMQVHGLHPHRGNWYLYITCLYWSVMTLSTVGYGDISPNTTEEKIFTIVVIFTGVSGYAMLIQAIGTAMAGDPNKLSHTKAMRNYLYDYEVPPDLAKRILHFLRLRDKKMRQEYIEPEVDLCIETLSKPLRRRLVLHTRRDLVERVPWFLGRPMKFVADVCPLLKSVVASPLEVVGATGVSASALVFVVKGDLAAFEHASKTPKCATPNTIKHGLSDLGGDIDKELLAYEAADRDRRYTWGPDSTFGLPGCVLDKTWRLDIIALDDCEMLSFPKDELLKLMGQHDHAAILPELVREAEESVAEHPALFSDADEAERPSSPPPQRDATASPTPDEVKSSYACDRLVARRADVAAFLAQHISPASLSADDESAALVRDFVEAHTEPERVPPTTETRRSPRQSPPARPLSPEENGPATLWNPSTDPPRARPVIVEDASTGPRARSVVVNDAPPPDDDDPAEMLCGALVGGE